MGKDNSVVKVNKNAIYLIAAVIIVAIAFYAYPRQSGTGAAGLSFNSAIGKPAPEFTLEDINGNKVSLSDYRGKTVVLFFNEGSMCYPSCWNQISELGKDSRFNAGDVAAFSIVVDTKGQWEEITAKTPGFSGSKILFDTDRTTSIAYGVLKLPSSMHPNVFPGHTYFIIDKNGIIRYVLDDPRMGIRNDLLFTEINKLGA